LGEFTIFSAGHAHVNLMTQSNGNRNCGCRCSERGLSGQIFALDISVIEHAPLIAQGNDTV
jgi:hypothetical protein